jgi:DNA-nicking Smr family endonuclease
MAVFVALGAFAALALLLVVPWRRRRERAALMPTERPLERTPREEPATIPIDGVLDLHHFQPKEVGDVVDAYLDECRAAGIRHVRLIHGKGKGVLRRTVHARLERRDDVREFALAKDRSGWGATTVALDLPEDSV